METNVTKTNFEQEVLKSEKTVIVDFWATWCGPCRMLAPIIEQISNEREDIKVCKCNVDEEEALAISYGIEVIPTVILFRNGKKEKQVSGYYEKNDLLKELGL